MSISRVRTGAAMSIQAVVSIRAAVLALLALLTLLLALPLSAQAKSPESIRVDLPDGFMGGAGDVQALLSEKAGVPVVGLDLCRQASLPPGVRTLAADLDILGAQTNHVWAKEKGRLRFRPLDAKPASPRLARLLREDWTYVHVPEDIRCTGDNLSVMLGAGVSMPDPPFAQPHPFTIVKVKGSRVLDIVAAAWGLGWRAEGDTLVFLPIRRGGC